MRRAAKVDDNQADIVKALRGIGATVQSLATVGDGCFDLLVGYEGVNYVMEVKDGNKPPSARKLTPKQVKWDNKWKGQKAVVKSVEEALSELLQESQHMDITKEPTND